MSKREEVANLIGEWLIMHKDRFNAPYGVIPGMKQTSRGKIRTITFGIRRILDATVEIWSSILIRIKAEGPIAHLIDAQQFSSAQDVIDFLEARIINS